MVFSDLSFHQIKGLGPLLVRDVTYLYVVGEMNLSKSGEFGVASFLSLWHMRSRVL